jgi:hypothetical protein
MTHFGQSRKDQSVSQAIIVCLKLLISLNASVTQADLCHKSEAVFICFPLFFLFTSAIRHLINKLTITFKWFRLSPIASL